MPGGPLAGRADAGSGDGDARSPMADHTAYDPMPSPAAAYANTGQANAAPGQRVPGEFPMTDDRKSMTVLIVEDEMMIATALEMMLSDRGYRVVDPVSTTEEALAVLQTVRPDVALLDYRLGGSTTEPLLQVLEDRRIPVCMLTGYGRAALPENCQKYSVLEKPFSLDRLLTELQHLCG